MTCVSVLGFFKIEAAKNGLINRRITNKIYLTCFESLIYIVKKEKKIIKMSKNNGKNIFKFFECFGHLNGGVMISYFFHFVLLFLTDISTHLACA